MLRAGHNKCKIALISVAFIIALTLSFWVVGARENDNASMKSPSVSVNLSKEQAANQYNVTGLWKMVFVGEELVLILQQSDDQITGDMFLGDTYSHVRQESPLKISGKVIPDGKIEFTANNGINLNYTGIISGSAGSLVMQGNLTVPYETILRGNATMTKRAVILNNSRHIQAAIDAAAPGEIIEVQSGIYRERLNVVRNLILVGLDTGKGYPILDAGGNGSAIAIYTDGVIVIGFNLTNCTGTLASGIKVFSDNNTIHEIFSSSNGIGILLKGAENNIINSCNVTNNIHGGILLEDSSNNNITDNQVNKNKMGISLTRSNGTYVERNTAKDNSIGIQLNSSNNNSIADNQVDKNKIGIDLIRSIGTVVERNTAENNSIGIQLDISNNNFIRSNKVEWNNYDIRLSRSYGNTIENNYYLTNNTTAWDDGGNQWIGNFWNGLIDKTCYIPGGLNADAYPNFGGGGGGGRHLKSNKKKSPKPPGKLHEK
jgi:parallel beta-helix repeat protein